MAYITKFSLAEFIKRQLVLKINKGPFVVMFDESLNHATKTKAALHTRLVLGRGESPDMLPGF